MQSVERSWRYIRKTDWYLLFASIACSLYGLVLISSATHAYETNKFLIVQGSAIVLGLVVFFFFSVIDIEPFVPYWKYIYLANLLFQASVRVLGSERGGNRSWIEVGPITIQPAEIGKLIFIFTLAAQIEQLQGKMHQFKSVCALLAQLFLLMGVIVVASGDMGSALAYFAIFIIVLFASGASMKWFFGGIVVALLSVPFLWNFLLKPYQKNRILVLLDPSIDPNLAYQTTQGKIAIGAGQLFGAGYLQGNQTQYGMLPAKHTDFIFAVAGEEFGLIGCLLILLLLGFIIARLFFIAYQANSSFSSYMVIGLGGMFLFQLFENVFMCIGFLPIMGLTLPFFSYGGTSVLTMFCAIGMAAGVSMRKKPSWLK